MIGASAAFTFLATFVLVHHPDTLGELIGSFYAGMAVFMGLSVLVKARK